MEKVLAGFADHCGTDEARQAGDPGEADHRTAHLHGVAGGGDEPLRGGNARLLVLQDQGPDARFEGVERPSEVRLLLQFIRQHIGGGHSEGGSMAGEQ